MDKSSALLHSRVFSLLGVLATSFPSRNGNIFTICFTVILVPPLAVRNLNRVPRGGSPTFHICLQKRFTIRTLFPALQGSMSAGINIISHRFRTPLSPYHRWPFFSPTSVVMAPSHTGPSLSMSAHSHCCNRLIFPTYSQPDHARLLVRPYLWPTDYNLRVIAIPILPAPTFLLLPTFQRVWHSSSWSLHTLYLFLQLTSIHFPPDDSSSSSLPCANHNFLHLDHRTVPLPSYQQSSYPHIQPPVPLSVSTAANRQHNVFTHHQPSPLSHSTTRSTINRYVSVN